MKSRGVFCCVIMAVLVLASAAVADIPRLINFQGMLTDVVGVPVSDDSYTVGFIIYDDSTSGSQLWYEAHVVETDDGLFNVQLGRHTSLDESIFIDHADLFIAIQLSGYPEMSPRTRLTSSAFCYQASHAVHADVAAAAVIGGGWRDDDTAVRLDNAADNVGIGTSTPAAKLDVDGDVLISGKTTFGTMQTNTGDKATITGGNANVTSGDGAVIGGGDSNVADSLLTTIGGGQGNYASGTGTTIGGGVANQAFALFSTISGGGPSDFGDILNTNNKIYDNYGTIGGGSGNKVGTNDGSPENNTHATVSGGYNNWAASIGSSIGGGRENFVEGHYATVAGGGGPTPSDGNYARGDWATISGGVANLAPGLSATVGGGATNYAREQAATVGGGATNRADSAYSTVGGGVVNSAKGNSATVGGGSHNTTLAQYATVSGGYRNIVSGESAVVGGGEYCYARAHHSVVAGGGGYTEADSNSALGDWSVIGGGQSNIAYDSGAVISGGCFNRAQGAYSVVAGGGGERIAFSNSAAGTWAVVGGGCSNTAGARAATVSGGYGNSATVAYATIAGGIDNDAAEQFASIGGGMNNTASAEYSTVVGGEGNEAAGYCSAVLGGQGNTASGNYSVAAGLWANAIHNGTFVWADNTGSTFQSTHNNQFLIRASGGVGIGTVSPGAMLDVADDDRALRLRAGNGQAEFTDNQIMLSYGGTVNYSHAIKSRHSSGNASMNAIEFYVWDPAVDASIEVGTKHVMTIDGEGVSGEVGIGTTDPNYTLDVRGTIGNNATLYHSDERWKMSVETIPDALEKVNALRGVNFEWRQNEFAEMNFPSGKHIGVIAQEVESVLPELVNTAEDGYKSVEYANLTAVLIEAVKELKAENDELKRRMADLEEQLIK